MTIGKIRTALYALARLLGDVNAVARGRILQRIANRLIGRFFSRWFIR